MTSLIDEIEQYKWGNKRSNRVNNILSQHTLKHIEKEIQYSQKEIPKARGEAQIQAQQPK